MTLPPLRIGSQPGPNIQFLDWQNELLTMANSFCQRWSPTGATNVVASRMAWEDDPRNSDNPNAAPPTFLARTTYPEPTRTAGDTAAERVIHDRAGKHEGPQKALDVKKTSLIEL